MNLYLYIGYLIILLCVVIGYLLWQRGVSVWDITQAVFRSLFFGALKWLTWLAIFVALLALMVAVAGVLGFVLWLATAVIAMMVDARYVESERRALLALLALATDKGIPLADVTLAFGAERHDKLGRRARRLGEALERGLSLPAAIQAAGIRLPVDAAVAINTAGQSGHLSASLRTASYIDPTMDAVTHGIAAKVMYCIAFVAFMTLVIGFMQYKIVPEFIKIFDGFGLRLPEVTLITIRMSLVAVRHSELLILGILGVAALLAGVLGRYLGWITWDPPVVRRLWRELDEANILRTLAQAVEEGRPLLAAVAQIAHAYPKEHIRRRLIRASEYMSNGAHWCDSLRSAGLLRSTEAGVIKSAERVGNLPWALREMADRDVRRFAARATAQMAIAYPIVLLCLASIILLVAAGVLLPLIELIENLA